MRRWKTNVGGSGMADQDIALMAHLLRRAAPPHGGRERRKGTKGFEPQRIGQLRPRDTAYVL